MIEWARQEFERHELVYGHGTDNPGDEAVYLVLRTLGLDFDADDSILNQKLTSDQINKVAINVKQRITTRKPVAYLLNEAWFAGLPFYVNERVLIPRSPIAELIHEQFSPWCDAGKVQHVLDIGTGSGCIAIATALALPASSVDAVDISPEALSVARVNVDKYDLQNRVHLIESDLFSALSGKRYDLIIANPPYVDDEDMESLPPEYRHEPELGLYSGHDGLDVTRRILQQASAHLNPGGVIIVEVGNSQVALTESFPQVPFTWLEFEYGGEGVFLLYYDDLVEINFQ